MILQGVRRQKPYLGVCCANDSKKGGGYTTPTPALDLTTSLRGDLRPISGTQPLFWPLTHPPTHPGGGGFSLSCLGRGDRGTPIGIACPCPQSCHVPRAQMQAGRLQESWGGGSLSPPPLWKGAGWGWTLPPKGGRVQPSPEPQCMAQPCSP